NGNWYLSDDDETTVDYPTSIVYAKAVDSAGNESEVVSCPVKIGITGDMTDPDYNLIHHDMLALDVNINDGYKLYVLSGGVASNTTVNSGGSLHLQNGGTAVNTTVNPSGYLLITGNGVADVVMIHSGGSASVEENGLANSVTVGESAYLHIFGTANDVSADDGYVYIYNGGRVVNAAIGQKGHFIISSGGTVTGKMTFANGAVVSAYEGAVIDFDISGLVPDNAALANNLSLVKGAPTYTLTVDGSQAEGAYKLATGAAGFNKTITVVNTEGTSLGTLTVGQRVTIGEADYTLNLNDGTLSVEVVSSVVPSWTFFEGDFNGDLFDTLAVQKDSTVTIYQNGEAWGAGLTLDPGWDVVGTGDFNADGRDDFLRVNTEGYVVGEMANDNGTFSPQVLNFKGAGWQILGTGNFDGVGPDDVLVANPTGASETVGLLGYWESGVTWTLINGYSPEWECVSTGDFNGDGKCDMLWRNSFVGDDSKTYNAYCTWIVEDPVDWRMVSVSDPSEWNFLCAGDFDGDNVSDIAMINGEGVVGIWGVADGYLSSWSILSAVNTNEWSLIGAGDFNADGTDDIAWCNNETGLAGYWRINDKQLAAWQNIATVS
ncbi:MAG: AIDA repeat-containing protein, partial [Lentisphaeria bacterium]|nr:AIDA repeat-containing protein [Lentisphaeria bacterium]